MGLIDRLRATQIIGWAYNDSRKDIRSPVNPDGKEAADALEKLMHYAEHEMGCLGLPHACMCGLGELLKELSDEDR